MMQDILIPGINCCEISEVEETGLLVDGSDYYRAFCAAAETACADSRVIGTPS